MAERTKRTFILLAAYEDFTRKETVALQDEDFPRLLSIQSKKRRVVEDLRALDESLSDLEKNDFSERVRRLQEFEQTNAEKLKTKAISNRQELKQLTQNAVSASKLRNAYVRSQEGQSRKTTLDGKA